MKVGKWFIIFLTMIFAAYPVIELTRLILASMVFYPEMKGYLVFEISFIWTLYLTIVPILSWALGKTKTGS